MYSYYEALAATDSSHPNIALVKTQEGQRIYWEWKMNTVDSNVMLNIHAIPMDYD